MAGIVGLAAMALAFILPDTRSAILYRFRPEGSNPEAELRGMSGDPERSGFGQAARSHRTNRRHGSRGRGSRSRAGRVAHTDDIALRSWAIEMGLGKIGPPAIPALGDLAKDRSIRNVVVLTLGNMGPEGADAVPFLVERLGDDRRWTRTLACMGLGKIGASARAPFPF